MHDGSPGGDLSFVNAYERRRRHFKLERPDWFKSEKPDRQGNSGSPEAVVNAAKAIEVHSIELRSQVAALRSGVTVALWIVAALLGGCIGLLWRRW